MPNFKIIFNRKNKLNADKQAVISIEVYHNYKRKIISTGIFIEPRFWDENNKIIKSSHPDSFKYNTMIKNKLNDLKNIELETVLKNKEFSLEMIDAKNQYPSFTDFFIKSIESRKSLRLNTRLTHISAYNVFKKFAGNVSFKELTYKLIFDYDNYLRAKYMDYTVHTKQKILRTYINLAIKQGLMEANDYPYRNFKLKPGKSNRIDLSFEQLKKLESLQIPDQTLEQIKDLFLFSCYTGLRFEDVMDLKPDDIRKNRKGDIEINKTVIKTNDKIRLPISILFGGKALVIIDKYKNMHNQKCLPQYTNQAVNRLLKALSTLITYNFPLTFHIARHTFGSRMAELKPDPYVIQQLMGHKDIKTSMDYIKTSGDVLEDKLRNTNW